MPLWIPSCRIRRPPWTTSAGRLPAAPPAGGPPPSSSSVTKTRPRDRSPSRQQVNRAQSSLLPPYLTRMPSSVCRRGGDLRAVRVLRHLREPDHLPHWPARAVHGVSSRSHQRVERRRAHAAAARRRRRRLVARPLPRYHQRLPPLHSGMLSTRSSPRILAALVGIKYVACTCFRIHGR